MVPTFNLCLLAFLLTLLSEIKADFNFTINSYDPEYGVYIGELPDPSDADVKGRVYVINETVLQIINFTYNGKAPGTS
ncbi:unnamed protein product [Gongylonema pulchrum]|uniref:DM13 domain-containing protein n=1 Tax=Gongylonema pulchrum TaxID=637853 RepID=A0A183EXT6_9BILA|nr:unnamed protein product [Gongylonema pulchrum]